MIREIGRSLGNAVLEGVGRAASRFQENKPLPVDLLESDEEYLAVFDAPGATSSDVQVRFADRTIHVRIDRFREFHEGFEMRVPGRGLALDGRVRLPKGAVVDPEGATAVLRPNGTLEVHVPRGDGDRPIEISTGTAAPVADDAGAGDGEGDNGTGTAGEEA